MWWADADVLGEYFNGLYFDGEALLFVDGVVRGRATSIGNMERGLRTRLQALDGLQ